MGSNVYIGLGSNLENRGRNLERARERLDREFGVLARSTVRETEPFEVSSDNDFLNQVLEIDPGEHGPADLLERLLAIERDLGRSRERDSVDRVIDLDLLYYDRTIHHTNQLDVPHPEVHRRPFVLKGMVELNPVFRHPELDKSQTELLLNALGQKNDN